MKNRMDTDLLIDEEGNPEKRFLPLDVVIVPDEIELSSDSTVLEVSDEEEYWYGIGAERQLTAGCLSQFIQLTDEPPRRILSFAQRWGLLGLCSHGQPATHKVESREGRERSVLIPYGGCTPAPEERISDWRALSRRFRTIVEVGQQLHRAEPVADDAVWESIGRPRRVFVVGGSGDSLPYQKRRLARAVNLQLSASGIQPILSGIAGLKSALVYSVVSARPYSPRSQCNLR